MGQEFTHRPVLLDECIENLNIRPDGVYLDGTLGRAGHSWEIVRRLNVGGRLIGLDRDETALVDKLAGVEGQKPAEPAAKLERRQTGASAASRRPLSNAGSV